MKQIENASLAAPETSPAGFFERMTTLLLGKKARQEFTVYLPDADEIEETPIASGYPITLYTLVALIASLALWAALTEIDQVVTTRGRLISTVPNIVIQSIETAQIQTINVTIGQVVKKGEVLATLEPTFITADLTQVKDRLQSLDAQVSRLEAEQTGKPYQGNGNGDQQLQSGLDVERLQAYRSRLQRFDENIARIRSSSLSITTEISGLERRVESLREIENMNAVLLEKQFQSKKALLESRDKRLEVERELINAKNRSNELVRELQGTEADKNAFVKEYRQKNFEDLVNAKRERDGLKEQLAKVNRRSNLIQIISPEDGVVLEVAKVSKGSVIREAETLLTLVPARGNLEAEIKIDAGEISTIALHNTVRVKIDSYPFQKYGIIKGDLIKLSHDVVTDTDPSRQGQGVYVGRVVLKEFDKDMNTPEFKIMPGMSLVAEVVTTKKRVLSYLLYPIMKSKDEAINEQ